MTAGTHFDSEITRVTPSYEAVIRWNISDATEAVQNAVAMSDWDGVIKYANQLKALERRLYDAVTIPVAPPK